MRTIRNLHRYSAIPIAIFAVVHLTNHLASLLSISSHLAFMQAARLIYRQPVVEAVLLLAVALQIGSGVSIIVQRWRQHRCLASLQVWSGACLAFFLCAHVGAVLFGRSILKLDTNFYFAAAGFHVAPYQYVFAPYYFLGVLAFFTHVGCAACWRINPTNRAARMLAQFLPGLIGGIIGLLICMSLAGMILPVQVPASYKATFGLQNAEPKKTQSLF